MNEAHTIERPTDIDELFRPTQDERARRGFVSALRNHAKVTMRDAMQRHYEQVIEPAHVALHGHPPASGAAIEELMQDQPAYQIYGSVRYNAQRMVYLTAIDPIEREHERLVQFARAVASERPAGGTLRLNPELVVPRYVTALDVHLIPGGFHSEYVADDVAQGALIAWGGQASRGANAERADDGGGVGRSIATWLERAHPKFKPAAMLDLGTQSGKNLVPYLEVFPQVEAHGVDVSAPALRYGHVKAECAGKRVHFSQQNAEELDFPDEHFQLIVSSFFFHELPLKATHRILAECHRLLAPGGMMVHMELPPHELCTAWQNFYWDWDAKHNNEPFYVDFRSQDLPALMSEAGFDKNATFMRVVPNVATFDMQQYDGFLAGEVAAPLHGRGGWFVFGARKDG